MSITTNIEILTPKAAKDYLDAQTHNRKLSKDRVSMLAGDIASGRWRFNGEAIKFDEQGILIDGQHRCAACVKAGVPIKVLVIRGLPKETQETMDTGKARSFSDILVLRGVPCATNIAAAVRRIWGSENVGFKQACGEGSPRATSQALLAFYEATATDARYCMNLASRVRSATGVPVSLLACIIHEFRKVAEDAEVEWFCERLIDGAGLDDDDPILMLRNTLQKMLIASRTKSFRGQMQYTAGLIVVAWNYWAAGVKPKILKWTAGGAHPQPFPTPQPIR